MPDGGTAVHLRPSPLAWAWAWAWAWARFSGGASGGSAGGVLGDVLGSVLGDVESAKGSGTRSVDSGPLFGGKTPGPSSNASSVPASGSLGGIDIGSILGDLLGGGKRKTLRGRPAHLIGGGPPPAFWGRMGVWTR